MSKTPAGLLPVCPCNGLAVALISASWASPFGGGGGGGVVFKHGAELLCSPRVQVRGCVGKGLEVGVREERLFWGEMVCQCPLKSWKAHFECLQASDTPDNSPKERIFSEELGLPPSSPPLTPK